MSAEIGNISLNTKAALEILEKKYRITKTVASTWGAIVIVVVISLFAITILSDAARLVRYLKSIKKANKISINKTIDFVNDSRTLEMEANENTEMPSTSHEQLEINKNDAIIQVDLNSASFQILTPNRRNQETKKVKASDSRNVATLVTYKSSKFSKPRKAINHLTIN